MKKLISFISLAIIFGFFLSCDGRDRVHKSPETVLKENKLLDSFSENITYIPEQYSEVITDTILSKGYRINIKSYTDMNSYIEFNLKSSLPKTINSKTRYYNFISELNIYNPENEIEFSQKIDKNYLVKNNLLNLDKVNSNIFKSLNLIDYPKKPNTLEFELIYTFGIDLGDQYTKIILIYNKRTKSLTVKPKES
ncbi:hypothetical protein [Aurantibacter sp.]|uniref:hypothetical protein n=1 Tax=Aurantibacter sp. TaxID=2807103 RepID=UPI0035C7E00F